MIKRIGAVPKKSFLLFGPRGTGKSTWLKSNVTNALTIDCLNSATFLKYASNPNLLREDVKALKPGSWVIVDEVQRVPEILNEVHWLYENRKLHFALSGSSARKLKRGGANLLAGRALQRRMFPFVHSEYVGKWDLKDAIDWGTLPLVVDDPEHRKPTLASYVETYLRQELLQEGLLRKLDPFARFLQIAGLFNGQVMNVLNVAREAHVGRTTVDKYFEILEDTLISTRLYPFQPSVKAKETSHPKLYFFDSGVARACAGLIYEELDPAWRGFALETYVLHELQAYNHLFDRNRGLSYYRISTGEEIDFVIEARKKTLARPPEVICIEVKLAKKWDKRWCEPSLNLASSDKVQVKARYGIYLGTEEIEIHGMKILPLGSFLRELYDERIF